MKRFKKRTRSRDCHASGRQAEMIVFPVTNIDDIDSSSREIVRSYFNDPYALKPGDLVEFAYKYIDVWLLSWPDFTKAISPNAVKVSSFSVFVLVWFAPDVGGIVWGYVVGNSGSGFVSLSQLRRVMGASRL